MLRNVVLTLGVGGVFVVLNEVLSLNAQELEAFASGEWKWYPQ